MRHLNTNLLRLSAPSFSLGCPDSTQDISQQAMLTLIIMLWFLPLFCPFAPTQTVFTIANGCITEQFSFHRKHHGTSAGIITCSHASTCPHVVFFCSKCLLFQNRKKKGGVSGHPPLFSRLEMDLDKKGEGRRFGTDSAVSNIWVSGHLGACRNLSICSNVQISSSKFFNWKEFGGDLEGPLLIWCHKCFSSKSFQICSHPFSASRWIFWQKLN